MDLECLSGLSLSLHQPIKITLVVTIRTIPFSFFLFFLSFPFAASPVITPAAVTGASLTAPPVSAFPSATAGAVIEPFSSLSFCREHPTHNRMNQQIINNKILLIVFSPHIPDPIWSQFFSRSDLDKIIGVPRLFPVYKLPDPYRQNNSHLL